MKYGRLIPGMLILAGASMPFSAFADEALQEQMLSHVEKIVVVDSLTVDKDAFFKRYKLQPSAGTILSGRDVAARLKGTQKTDEFAGQPLTGFTNEFDDYLIWAQEDTTGYLRLAESVRLIDGTWSQPRFTSPVLNSAEEDSDVIEANAAFPFMLDDGQTLYFASDNERSLGGYDIFVSTKDPSDGGFLIPGNLGMPFNSPYDDYLMVLDRQTGVGWWASDRNRLDGQLTIYIYALTEDRVNVDPEDELLLNYATLQGWQDLLDDDGKALGKKLRKEIAAIRKPDTRTPEFTLPMPGGKTYHYFKDFKNQRAAALMKQYLKEEATVKKERERLESLRESYYKSGRDRKIGTQIAALEEQLRSLEQNLKVLRSEVYKAESNI